MTPEMQNQAPSRLTFQLEPGGYRIREVVTDSEDHQMTAVSYNVKIP